jgi:hypothetical protein
VEEGAATATVLPGEGSEPVTARLGVDQEKEEQRSEGNPKTAARKKVVQQPI